MSNEVFFPGMDLFVEKVFSDKKNKSRLYTDIFTSTLNIIELSLHVFTGATIRFYEEHFAYDTGLFKKKIKPINDTLNNRFVAPSLGTLTSLAKSCIHLVNDSAPHELIKMKDRLNQSILMGPIGVYLDELTLIYDILDPDETAAKVIHRETAKKTFLSIINDLISFRNDSAHLLIISSIIEDNYDELKLSETRWKESFILILNTLEPFLNHHFRSRRVDRILTENGIKYITVQIREFNSGIFNDYTEKILLDDWYEDKWQDKCEMRLSSDTSSKMILELFPFLIIKDDKLFYYKKTKAKGYQYFSILDDKTYTYPSKNKFNKTVFKISENRQASFWTEVVPVCSPYNNIKANIPTESIRFIGRKRQINKIINEIIEVPNENGILYGPGGVGKTALLIELTTQLFKQPNIDSVLYENIIWVSAKSNFYSWESNATITNPQQFESLDNVLQIILHFFEYQNVAEYRSDDLKDLVLELLEDNKVLLILDNFETITKAETKRIIEFFGTDMKMHLKRKPNNFKIIITSRELIPSGFKQIKLDGLDLKESKQLIESIFERYNNSHSKLTIDQIERIHKSSSGIPLVIKHCLGQMFEFNHPLHDILDRLKDTQNEVIKFSFSEVLKHLKKDECYLKIIILLEILNEPISIRQISLILKISIHEISDHLSLLLNFQCLERINVGIEEKFRLSNEVGLLAQLLISENYELTSNIRNMIASNLTMEKKMDYAIEELEIIEIFMGYVEHRDFNYAEYFLTNKINERPGSQLLNYHYALFLRDRKKDTIGAIKILERLDEDIARRSVRDANILLALVSTYVLLEFPEYNKANKCCSELLKLSDEVLLILFVAEFKINWSDYLRTHRELDPIKDKQRNGKMKELAQEGIDLLLKAKKASNTHKYQYLMALAYYVQWKTEEAKKYLTKAIELAGDDYMSSTKYDRLMTSIKKFIYN